jgi:predicted nuclease of predicted toxin-antitoxin system
MIFWVDAQLPPNLADWLRWTFKVEAYALCELGLRDAKFSKELNKRVSF